MSNKVGDKCLICGDRAEVYSTNDINYKFIECNNCGRVNYNTYDFNSSYKIDKDILASYLYYNGKIDKLIEDEHHYDFIGSQKKFEEDIKIYPYAKYISKEECIAWYPKSFSEKVDVILIGFAKLLKFDGCPITFTDGQLLSALFIKRYNKDSIETSLNERNLQLKFILTYLEDNSYIKSIDQNNIMLLPNALSRIDKLQKDIALNSKYVFVAMSFAPEMSEVRLAIRSAIEQSGYIPRIMDEIEHNHQIVPEMLYEIRNSRFVIAELTGHNNGAYFEAGYALGLGKEVVHICKKDVFGTDGHFDVKQVNTILWENTEDLNFRLRKRIEATIM